MINIFQREENNGIILGLKESKIIINDYFIHEPIIKHELNEFLDRYIENLIEQFKTNNMKTQDLKQMEPTKTKWIVLLFILVLGLLFVKTVNLRNAEKGKTIETVINLTK
jgi:phosphoglycerol transferase MdoB-like AlkP superfamily enzyme